MFSTRSAGLCSALSCRPWGLVSRHLSRKAFLNGSRFIATRFTTKYTSTRHPEPQHFEFEQLEGVERLEKYRPGGYHPTRVGDVIQDRYDVVFKLGYGGYSITWLCHDRHTRQTIALKVGTAYSNPRESEILAFLGTDEDRTLEHPGRAMIPTVLDRFVLQSPNGVHACYTTTAAMCCLWGAKVHGIFAVQTARSLAAQLVLAVDFVHSRGVVHGDLHLSNMFLKLDPGFSRLSVQALHEKYGVPVPQPVVRLDGKSLPPGCPPDVVRPVWLGEPSESFPERTEILLKDFGEAYSPFAEIRDYSNTLMPFVPPEAHFEPDLGLSFPSDVWTLACAIWDILGDKSLFEGTVAAPDDMIAAQIKMLGGFPPEWREQWHTWRHYFSPTGDALEGRLRPSFEQLFEDHIESPRQKAGIHGFDEEEKAAILDLLRSMLSFRPEERLTTRQVLKSEWMVKWALPEYDQLHAHGWE